MGDMRELAGLPDVRRIELAWALSTIAWAGGTVAVLVLSYEVGGAGAVAAYSVARAVVGVIASALLSGLADRVRRDRLLRLTTGSRAVLVLTAAALAILGGDPVAVGVVTLVVLADGLAVTFRPLQAASLPWLVRTPGELASANVAATLMESVGSLLGPALAALGLLLADPAQTLAGAGLVLVLASLSLARLRLPEESRGAFGRPRILGDLAAGTRELWRLPPAGGFAGLAFLQTFARGVLTVGLVVYALDVLALGDDAVGWFNAAMGVGGLVGGFVGATVVRTTRLGRAYGGGVGLWGLALLLPALWPTVPVMVLAMTLVGIGNALEDAGAFTLLPRLAGSARSGRLLGAFELLVVCGVGLGSLAAPVLVDRSGARGAFALVGALVLVAALAWGVGLARLDSTTPAPSPVLGLLRGTPMFAPLPLVAVEQLADELTAREFAPGEVVVREGEQGRQFHLISQGRAEVRVAGHPRPDLAEGDCLGEIALLRDGVRTATVTAVTDLHTFALDRDDFLRAVTGNHLSAAAARSLVDDRLAGDPD